MVRKLLLAPARSALVLRVLTAAALSLGYLDLVRGGITVAPLLLVVGYLVLVPALILTRR